MKQDDELWQAHARSIWKAQIYIQQNLYRLGIKILFLTSSACHYH